MWHNFKMIFVDGLGLTDVQLHLGAGIFLFLVALSISHRAWFAFSTVAVLQAVNELIDLFESIATMRPSSVESIFLDTAWTLSGALLLAIFAGVVRHNIQQCLPDFRSPNLRLQRPKR